jgi:plasmanylethanolamine desaturase
MVERKPYAVWQFTLEATAITVFFTYVILYALSLMENFGARSDTSSLLWLELILYALGAYVAADFVSGMVHFLADNFGNPETPILGRLFIFPFREHHVDAKAITRHSFAETNGANCLVSLTPMIYFYYASAPVADFTFRFFMVCFFFSIFMTNQIHKWAHMDHPPALVALLQRLHLILPPDHHGIHHTVPYDKYYCITCGWLNPVLGSLHFFQALKRVLTWNFRF